MAFVSSANALSLNICCILQYLYFVNSINGIFSITHFIFCSRTSWVSRGRGKLVLSTLPLKLSLGHHLWEGIWMFSFFLWVGNENNFVAYKKTCKLNCQTSIREWTEKEWAEEKTEKRTKQSELFEFGRERPGSGSVPMEEKQCQKCFYRMGDIPRPGLHDNVLSK